MILYKYVNPDRLDILQNKLIRFTPINEFNDPFEFDFNVTMEKESVIDLIMTKKLDEFKKVIFNSHPHLKEMEREINFREILSKAYKEDAFQDFLDWKSIYRTVKQNISMNIGILSLSEIKDDLLMWGHYTANHTGMIIGFNKDIEMFKTQVSLSANVKYQKKKVNIHLTNLDDVRLNVDLEEKSLEGLFTKSTHWSYEKEWRIILPLDETESIHDINGLVSINPKSVSEIILGVNADEKLRRDVIRLKESSEYSHITIYKASINLNEYKLDIDNLLLDL